ncbi:MAG TPA: anaerobic ribonucleoside-triphosphate reductase, partial [Smithellaceae bacterium]|nr:anaerobic ribonucleoside-triphosphate reductase [Smithellaceae bacterium]
PQTYNMFDNSETTDLTLFVRTSGEEIARWNRQRIVDALVREASIDIVVAEAISKEVEQQIFSSSGGVLTTSLIRELVNAKLIERGLARERRLHGRLGFPLYDVRQLILHQNKENANIPHSPEGTNLLFAEGIKREFSLHDIFPEEAGNAHAAGDIHIHGLGYIDRPFSCCQTLEYLKLNGLKLPQSVNSAGPARHAEVLILHMVRFSAVLQGHFTGTIIWDALNISFAPYLAYLKDKEVRQLAQMLIYEFSQLSATRGGQPLNTDIHIYADIPEQWAKLPAIGPGGKHTGKCYGDYAADSLRFARAILEVFCQGDVTGKPFIMPRPLLHITEKAFHAESTADLLELACEVAARKGNTCFVLDREKTAQYSVWNKEDMDNPRLRRTAAIQSVSLNLPRIGYQAGGDENKLFDILKERVALAVKIHVAKKDFLEKLLSYAEQGPLAMLAMNSDGFPYLRMNRAFYIIGLLGLNELVQIQLGSQLHESEAALNFGLKIVEYLQQEVNRSSKEYAMRFVLEQSPAETTAYRFARLDLKHFSPAAGRYVKGDVADSAIYYTNSTHFNAAAAVSPRLRVMQEGLFHQYLAGEVISHLYPGDVAPDRETLCRFIRHIYRH